MSYYWWPIESAPRTGELILIYPTDGGWPFVVKWQDGKWLNERGEAADDDFRHWADIPQMTEEPEAE